MQKDTIKFIRDTCAKTNNQCEYRYRYFGAENYRIQVPFVQVLICVVPVSMGSVYTSQSFTLQNF